MYHDVLRTASFWSFLFSIDHELAETVRKQGCTCGGRLHRANYPRQPGGAPVELPKPQRLRLSFCCDRDGCRKRVTPPSVRFLGRKTFLGAIVILVSAMRQGPTPRRVRELSERFRVDPRTIARWQVFWREHFPKTQAWEIARARLVPTVEIVTLPCSLLDAFFPGRDPCEAWAQLLRFLAPFTIPGALRIEVSQ
jgi:hypothetical protein